MLALSSVRMRIAVPNAARTMALARAKGCTPALARKGMFIPAYHVYGVAAVIFRGKMCMFGFI